MSKKKRVLVIVLSCVLSCLVLYAGTWLLYRYKIVSAHFPTGFTLDESRPIGKRYHSYFSTEDPYGGYDSYHYAVPKFGYFSCAFGFTSSRILTDEGNTVIASGSKFSYSMGGNFRAFAKCKQMVISAAYYATPQTEIPEGAFWEVDLEGNLLNSEEISAQSVQLYNEAKPEIIEYISRLREIFHI